MKNWYWYIIGIIVIIVLTKQCEGEPRTITKTKIEYINVTDTITNTIIQEVPKTVYVKKTNDSIIYVNETVYNESQKVNDSVYKANQYDTKLESNNATADLKITTTGELLDVTGVINYTKEVKTIETTKIRDASGFYIYANMPVNSIQPEVGALYQFKNKMFISAGAQYNSFTKSADIKVGLGVKIF